MKEFKIGQLVYWHDPANFTSDYYFVISVPKTSPEDIEQLSQFDERIILISNGYSESEVYGEELDIIAPYSELQNVDCIDGIPVNLKMQIEYDLFVERYKQKPKYACCSVCYKNDKTKLEEVLIKLGPIDESDKDNLIFFYCDGLHSLLSLLKDSEEDFYIESFFGFMLDI